MFFINMAIDVLMARKSTKTITATPKVTAHPATAPITDPPLDSETINWT